MVVSEPLIDLPGLWREVPAGTALIVQAGEELRCRSRRVRRDRLRRNVALERYHTSARA